jgi:4a-hydroxytetrahydrobiopterin dehydratase
VARAALPEARVRELLAQRPGWQLRGDRIARTFRFPDFATAFGWMASAALVAERLNHHPDWKNVYDRVDVELTTHDAGGLTERDFELAAAMDRLAAGGPPPG